MKKTLGIIAGVITAASIFFGGMTASVIMFHQPRVPKCMK